MWRYLICFFFFIHIGVVFSQTSGFVFDKHGEPIGGVKVYLSDLDIITYTSSDGRFSFSSEVPVNTYFEFEKNGYSSKLHEYLGEEISVSLDELHVELDEVGIVEKSTKLGYSKTFSIES